MDKKKQKKSVIKRKSGDENSTMEAEVKKVKPGTVVRGKVIEEPKIMQQKPVEVMAPQTVEFTVAPNQQIIHANQIEGSFDQPVFLHMKGDPVHLGTNTVIVYEQAVNSGNFTFNGSLMMDASGRIMVTDNTIYDVKDDGQEEQYVTASGEGGSVMTEKEDGDIEGELLQYAIKVDDSEGDCYDANRRVQQQQQQQQHHQQDQQQQHQQQHQEQEYEIVQIVDSDQQEHAQQENPQETLSDNCGRWLNSKYDYIVRKLQLDYDAGVKLLHSPSGVLRCVYLTTPSMQLAFNSVPQFLCIETCIEFCSPVSGSNESVRQSLTLLLAEDGNGRSVIVSAGISTLGDNVKWLLETFKSCNPAWRQVRCILADPEHNTEAIKWCFPGSHVCCNVFQAVRWAARHTLGHPVPVPLLKSYIEALLKGQKPDPTRLRRCIGAAINRLPRLMEGDNYTNVLHKGLEKLVERFNPLMGPSGLQPEEFVTFFFDVVRNVEDGRQAYALSRLQDTVNSKQSPTDTITQYAYFLIHQQTTLAQRAINQQDENSTKEPNEAISKYGTSTQECSCIFSKVFRLPCRHILMLTTELKVKTHIPFEPRWTVHHCLFGCELETRSITPTTGGVAVVQNQNDQQIKQQYIMPPNEGQQVIFCSSSGSNANPETIQYAPVEAPGQPA